MFNFSTCFVLGIVLGSVNMKLQDIVSFLKEPGYFFLVYSLCHPVLVRLTLNWRTRLSIYLLEFLFTQFDPLFQPL